MNFLTSASSFCGAAIMGARAMPGVISSDRTFRLGAARRNQVKPEFTISERLTALG
jgi:hypothetical protein